MALPQPWIFLCKENAVPDRAEAWRRLDTELAAWADAGKTATLWWRDDDAGGCNDETSRLIDLHAEFAIPLTLAVVPCQATRSLAEAIAPYPSIAPIVHGYAHRNHAPLNAKQAEFGAHRPLAIMQAELGQALDILRQLFDTRLRSVLAPPWNRIAPGLTPLLPELGYCGLSAFQPALQRNPAPGLAQTNCHVDLIYWRRKIIPRNEPDVLNDLIAHLAARRRRAAGQPVRDVTLSGRLVPENLDPDEPTGILTHHLAHTPQAWELLRHVFCRLSQPGCPARWLACGEVF